jgi:hypothetical protein
MKRTRLRVVLDVLGASLLVSSLVVSAAPTLAQATTYKVSPCGTATVARYSHVVWIMLENEGYSVIGSPSAPYLNLVASQCGLATNDDAVSHPSLPNYIALTSGSTQGILDDNEPSSHRLNVPSIFSELNGNWRAYDQSMPRACDKVTSGSYAARHNPAVYYTNLPTCTRNDVPLKSPLNLSAAFTMITPNICNDMHSCSVATGDRWLESFIPSILSSSEYRTQSLVLFITFDENTNSSSNRIPTIVVAPTVPKQSQVSTFFTHYSLLKTSESLLHLPLLGGARHANSMVQPFHL